MTLRRFLAPLLALACLLAPVAASAQSVDTIARGLALMGVRKNVTASCGTVPTTQPCLDLTATWATTGTYVAPIRLRVTDSGPANNASLLFDVGTATSQFSVTKTGTILSGPAGGATFMVNAGDGLTRTFSTGGFAFAGSASADAAVDVVLRRDAANILAQRNGTSAQTFRIYNTFTDASNGEWANLSWDGSNHFIIQTVAQGTGSLREIYLKGSQVFFGSGASGTNAWKLDTSGNFLAVTDNTYDIGASGTSRPKNLYVAGTGIFGGAITSSSSIGGVNINASGQLSTGTTVVGSLPACGSDQGGRYMVSDATVAASGNFAAAVVGGGANKVPVYCDGTSWKIGALDLDHLSPANNNLPDGLVRAFG